MTFLKFNPLLRQTVIFSFIALFFLSLIRFASLILLQTDPIELSLVRDLFIIGLRFDARIIATILLFFIYIPALFFVCIKKQVFFKIWINTLLSISLFFILFISFVNFAYLQFFGSVIDVLIFGFIEDGTADVLKSMLSDNNIVIMTLFSAVLLYFILKYFITKASKAPDINAPCWLKTAWLLCLIPLMFVIARGTISTFPLTKQEAEISNSTFINSLSQNAVYHLYNAFLDRDFNSFNSSTRSVLQRAKVTSQAELEQQAGFSLDKPLRASTPYNPLLEKNPPHVIFVLMEGWSTQIALTDSAHTLNSFNQHRLDDYFFSHFFSNAYGTNPSIEALLLNSPITPLSQSTAYATSFRQSSILPFKRNNYRTVFLSGGHAAWRNHDKFWLKQGFDEFTGRVSIAKKYGTSDNTWGVYDEYLFAYLWDDLKQQQQPSFYFVLTTNNHPPIELPDDYQTPDFDLKQFPQHTQTKEMLRGFSYQSNALGQFMTQLKNSPLKDKVIVVATGDHILKGFDNYHAIEKTFFKYAVPAYFYLPRQYDTFGNIDLSLSGSHNDLFPTLFHLALSNTNYFNFGTPLMLKSKTDSFGWIQNKAFIVNEGVIDLNTKKYYAFKAGSLLLDNKPHALQAQQKKLVRQQQNLSLLKEYLLYQDKEQ